MKHIITYRRITRALMLAVALMAGVSTGFGQNSLPAPGAGGSYQPNTGPGMGMGWTQTPPPPYWGSLWYDGWETSPSVVVSPTVNTGNFQNQGITKVIACGYDAQGVWRVLPLVVSYQYNGVQYSVNVLNAWNPWTESWDKGVDVPAYNTDYYLRNVEYSFYTVLSTGTFYFNL